MENDGKETLERDFAEHLPVRGYGAETRWTENLMVSIFHKFSFRDVGAHKILIA